MRTFRVTISATHPVSGKPSSASFDVAAQSVSGAVKSVLHRLGGYNDGIGPAVPREVEVITGLPEAIALPSPEPRPKTKRERLAEKIEEDRQLFISINRKYGMTDDGSRRLTPAQRAKLRADGQVFVDEQPEPSQDSDASAAPSPRPPARRVRIPHTQPSTSTAP